MKSQRAFTLIELMVVLLVLGVMLGWGVPAFQQTIENNRVSGQSNAFLGALALARSEAVAKGVGAYVSRTGATWADGWRVWVDLDNDGTYDDPGEAIRVFESLQGGTTMTPGTAIASIPFDSKGYLAVAVGTTYLFTLESPNCSGTNARQVTVAATGRAEIARVACS